ncbi:MAG: hypothetical protein Q4P65_03595 [Eubacteriales bacterium]|nr:hypothetical protein [Eubacteriales bacterium]
MFEDAIRRIKLKLAKGTIYLLVLLSLTVLVSNGGVHILPIEVHAEDVEQPADDNSEEAQEPIVLPEESDEEQGSDTEPDEQEVPDTAPTPGAQPEPIVSTLKIDWSEIDASKVPAEMAVVVVPDGNNVYRTSLYVTADTNWEQTFSVPYGTQEINFSIQIPDFQFSVNIQGSTYILKASKTGAASDPLINTVNTNPGEGMSNIAIPTANNEVPPNAELKIRIDKGDADRPKVGFVQESERSIDHISEQVRQIEQEYEEKQKDNNKWLYYGAAVLASILALSLIGLRLSMAIKARKARKREAEYYSQRTRRRRR